MPSANDPQTGWRHALVLEKASVLFDSGEYHAAYCGNGVWGVYKRSGSVQMDTAYTVNLNANTCNCPYFRQWQDTCKHLLAVQILIDREAMEAQIEQEERYRRDGETSEGCDPYAEF